MDKKFLIAGVVAAVLAQALGFLVHSFLLGADYAKLQSLFRPEAEMNSYMPYMLLANIVFGFALAWIYRQGKTPGVPALRQGISYGLAVAALVIVPMYLIYYTIQPMPGALVAKQIVFDSIAMVLLGIVVAYLSRAPGEA